MTSDTPRLHTKDVQAPGKALDGGEQAGTHIGQGFRSLASVASRRMRARTLNQDDESRASHYTRTAAGTTSLT